MIMVKLNQSTTHLNIKKMGLSDQIQEQEVKARIVADCAKLMDEQVATKRGLSGLATENSVSSLEGHWAGVYS